MTALPQPWDHLLTRVRTEGGLIQAGEVLVVVEIGVPQMALGRVALGRMGRPRTASCARPRRALLSSNVASMKG